MRIVAAILGAAGAVILESIYVETGDLAALAVGALCGALAWGAFRSRDADR